MLIPNKSYFRLTSISKRVFDLGYYFDNLKFEKDWTYYCEDIFFANQFQREIILIQILYLIKTRLSKTTFGS